MTDIAVNQELKELRFLVGILLHQSGLDADGVERAFALARTEVTRIDAEMIDIASQALLATPEGEEQHVRYVAEQRRRQHEAWREACIEDGRIYPRPSPERNRNADAHRG